jgi:hypothetical protein
MGLVRFRIRELADEKGGTLKDAIARTFRTV